MVKKPSHLPVKPLTEKRKKILAVAMAQLRKTRAQMDPVILKKIRTIIAGNPKIMKGLGIDKMPDKEKRGEPVAKAEPHVQAPVKTVQIKDEEKIDQAHNMEVIAKLMALKPSEIENIKAVLLKTRD